MLASKNISHSLPASAIELGKMLYTFLWMFRGLTIDEAVAIYLPFVTLHL